MPHDDSYFTDAEKHRIKMIESTMSPKELASELKKGRKEHLNRMINEYYSPDTDPAVPFNPANLKKPRNPALKKQIAEQHKLMKKMGDYRKEK